MIKKFLSLLAMKSDTGMGILLVNVVGMMWLDVAKHGLGTNEVAIVGLIWAAKTTHGVMTDEKA